MDASQPPRAEMEWGMALCSQRLPPPPMLFVMRASLTHGGVRRGVELGPVGSRLITLARLETALALLQQPESLPNKHPPPPKTQILRPHDTSA